MTPKKFSSLGFKYPASRDSITKSGELWLQDKRNDDGAEGLWRIYDDLYDFTSFVKQHPGGKMWLNLSKGTDITEAFEVHHISNNPNLLLKNYYVRKASTARQSPYTFKDDGFYKTLKRNARPILEKLPKSTIVKSNLIADLVLASTFILSIASCYFWLYSLAAFAGLTLYWNTVIGHNYFHQKDNFRRYYFDFSLMESREWRITHVLSHHVLTNTIHDIEISFFEPILDFLPTPKSTLKKIVTLISAPILGITLFHASFAKRVLPSILTGKFTSIRVTNLIPFTIPAVMYSFGQQTLLDTFGMWTFIVLVASTKFGIIGLSVGHHHPDIFHDGDAPRENKDWGICQLDAVMERKETSGNHFLVLTYFGDHALHHMFPTLDQGLLYNLYPVFEETCQAFGINLRTTTQFEMIKGNLLQLLREERNEEVTDLFKY